MNGKLLFLLNPSIISDLSKTYQWAMSSQDDFNKLSDREKRDILDYRINWDYKSIAIEIINSRYRGQLDVLNIDKLTWTDLERSYCISKVTAPKDRIGIIYLWIHSYLSILNDKIDKSAITADDGKVDLKPLLYGKFMSALESNPITINGSDIISALKRSKDGHIDPASLKNVFFDVLDVVLYYNTPLQLLYENHRMQAG